MSNKLLIFGSGFLVKHITEEHLKEGWDVNILYNNHKVVDVEDLLQHRLDDINIVGFIGKYKPSYILFAAGDSFVSDNVSVEMAIKKNVVGAVQILNLLSTSDISSFLHKIIVIGSAAEYHNTHLPLNERDDILPSSIYGLSKIFLYNACMYYINKGLPIIYVRQFNAIGPYQRDKFVLAAFTKQLVLIENNQIDPTISVGNLNCQRDFIDGRDAAAAYRLLFERGEVGEVYNISTGRSIVIGELLDRLLKKIKYEGTVRINRNNKDKISKNELGDILVSDATKLNNLGFKRKYTLDQTIEDTLNFWRNNV